MARDDRRGTNPRSLANLRRPEPHPEPLTVRTYRVCGTPEAHAAFGRLTTEQRGHVVAAGLESYGGPQTAHALIDACMGACHAAAEKAARSPQRLTATERELLRLLRLPANDD